MLSVPAFVIEWQRLLDPSRMVAGRGAGYHTAPAVLVPGAPDIPGGAIRGHGGMTLGAASRIFRAGVAKAVKDEGGNADTKETEAA